MTTLDDRLLGEKLQNYCSSSEDERGKTCEWERCSLNVLVSFDLDDDGSDDGNGKRGKSSTKFIPESELQAPSSSSGFTENVSHERRVRK